MRSCDRPWKRSASDALPLSVSNRYSLLILTHGSSCRRRASSSLRWVSSFSALSSSRRSLSHSSRVPVLCFVVVSVSFVGDAILFLLYVGGAQKGDSSKELISIEAAVSSTLDEGEAIRLCCRYQQRLRASRPKTIRPAGEVALRKIGCRYMLDFAKTGLT